MKALSTGEIQRSWHVNGALFSQVRDFLVKNCQPVAQYNSGGRAAFLWPSTALSRREEFLATLPPKNPPPDPRELLNYARKVRMEKRESLNDTVRKLEHRIELLEAMLATKRTNGTAQYEARA